MPCLAQHCIQSMSYNPSRSEPAEVACRYICILASGDSKLEIREAGAKGLMPPSGQTSLQHQALHVPGLAVHEHAHVCRV